MNAVLSVKTNDDLNHVFFYYNIKNPFCEYSFEKLWQKRRIFLLFSPENARERQNLGIATEKTALIQAVIRIFIGSQKIVFDKISKPVFVAG